MELETFEQMFQVKEKEKGKEKQGIKVYNYIIIVTFFLPSITFLKLFLILDLYLIRYMFIKIFLL